MSSGVDPGFLSGVTLFQGLGPEQLAKIGALLQHRSFPAGTNIIMADHPGEVVYIVVVGSVKVFAEQGDGAESVLAVLGPGEIVGEMGLINSLGRSANVVTGEKSTLMWMDRATFWTLMRKMPRMSHNLVEILSRRLRLANARTQMLTSLDAGGRVAGQILALAREYGHPSDNDGGIRIPFRITQTDLAGMVGASRVRVNQVLGFYKKQNHISVSRDHRITVHDPEALARSSR